MIDINKFYTPIDQVKTVLKNRWADKLLKKKVEKYLNGDIPEILKNSQKAILFRHIISPDGELERLIKLAAELSIDPVGFEYTHDKFVAFNEDKYVLANLPFNLGIRNDGNPKTYSKKIIDLPSSEGKLISAVRTLWGESLQDFHHRFIEASHPGFSKSIFDISQWLSDHGGCAKSYYAQYIALTVRNGLLFEDFLTSGTENRFTHEVFIPAFEAVEVFFGIKPLIVRLGGADCETNPAWWHYKAEQLEIVKELVKKLSVKSK